MLTFFYKWQIVETFFCTSVCLYNDFLHMYRMTVYSRFGIPLLAGDPQWWSRTRLIKSLFLFTSPLFTWLILARSLVCPGGRPASTCPSKKAHMITHIICCKRVYLSTFVVRACCLLKPDIMFWL